MKIITSRTPLALLSLLVALLTFTAGCGGGGGGQGAGDGAVSASMQIGTTYTITPGDSVVPQGPANITVTHILNSDLRTVVLHSGSATLLKGAYSVQ
ncbi:hypothetical protein [Chrysiogenes arsenatis]|uniref:hypothetical protein n=1 Tax=Chrysiogenes arsenatis TaxID=309797 RepID=UPI0004107CA9|nr:hypothetical protein [Chrysiogenes arsenatis]